MRGGDQSAKGFVRALPRDGDREAQLAGGAAKRKETLGLRNPLAGSKRLKVHAKPDWTQHAKAAPFKRNDQMLDIRVWKFGTRGP